MTRTILTQKAIFCKFAAKVEISSSTECLIWKAGKTKSGYGHFRAGETIFYAHRFSYEYFIGPIPPGLHINHLCCNKECVNPLHLEPLNLHVQDVMSRIEARIRKEDNGCWIWTGCKTRAGYARMSIHSVEQYVHRYMYVQAKGAIPDGLQIDHLCRNRACVNPNHLEAVTSLENTLRGENRIAIKRRTGLCINGHEVNETNVGRNANSTWCRVCAKERARRKAAAK